MSDPIPFPTQAPKASSDGVREHSASLQAVWLACTEVCKSLFPKKWHMPPGYHNPEFFLPQAVAQLFIAEKKGIRHELDAVGDPVMSAWLLTVAGLQRYGSRVYAIEPTLAHDLALTSPEGFDFASVIPNLPLPAFMLSVPRGTLPTTGDGEVMVIGVCYREGVGWAPDPEDPVDFAGSDPDNGAFCIVAALESGAAYTFITPAHNELLFKLLSAQDVRYSRSDMDFVLESAMARGDSDTAEQVLLSIAKGLEQPDDAQQLHKIALFTLNAIAYMAAGGQFAQDVEESELHRPAKKRSERCQNPDNVRDFFTPWIVGPRYARHVRPGRGPDTPGTGAVRGSTRLHWRCGHWRRQAFGKGRKERRLIHVAPVLVNAPKPERKENHGPL